MAAQYGIRLAKERDMTWREFACLLSGLMGETPLGRVVRIRLERNAEVLRKHSPAERRIRAEWQRFRRARERTAVPRMDEARLQAALAACFTERK